MKLDNQVGDVLTIKLNSGEELISKIVKIEDDAVFLHEPVSVAPGPQGMGLIPSLFTADPKGETRLNINAIAIVAPTDESVKAKYIQATSGIIIPDKKLILG